MDSYFNGIWKDTNYEYLEHSGYSLVDYVNDQKPSSVLDVGCGYNKLKGKIHNLIGIDPYNDAADVKVSVENYKSAPYDIALCLGSINFGKEENINHQLDKLHLLWRRKAIFRVNPGIPHASWDQFIEWYPWTPKKIYSIAKQYKYDVECLKMEYTKEKDLRYFFIYTK